jgi:RHS repeat-associated protein
LAQPRRIEFIYDATGVKLRKTIFVNSVATDTTSYINGIEYKGKALDRFPHTEGAVVRQTDGTFQHEYTIKDHLGNARVTYIDKNADGKVDSTEIKQVNHYYAFGLNMEGNFNGASGTNKYQYNGKEWNDDFGLGLNDYGARFYDAAIGRFTAVDPLSLMFAPMSPYQYARNSPINFVDPTGMASEAWTSINQANNNSSNQQTQTDNAVKTDQQKYNSINRSTDIEGSGTSITAVGYKTIDGKTGTIIKNVLEGFRIGGYKANGSDCGCPNPPCVDRVIDKTDALSTGAGVAIDFQTLLTNGISKLDKSPAGRKLIVKSVLKLQTLGTGVGILGAVTSSVKASRNLTLGSVAKASFDIAVLRFGPYAGIADGAWDVSGHKDDFFNGLDKKVEAYIKSQQEMNKKLGEDSNINRE